MKALTQNPEKIVEVMNNSKVVEISKDGQKIRKVSFCQKFVRIDDNGQTLPKFVKNKPKNVPKIYTQYDNSEESAKNQES